MTNISEFKRRQDELYERLQEFITQSGLTSNAEAQLDELVFNYEQMFKSLSSGREVFL